MNGLPTEFFTVPLDWHQPQAWTAEQRLHGTIHLANAFAKNRLAPSSPETRQAYDDLVAQTSVALDLSQPVITASLKTAWSTLLKRSPEMPLTRADPPDAEKARLLLEEAAAPHDGEQWSHFQRVIRLANLGLAELVTDFGKTAPA